MEKNNEQHKIDTLIANWNVEFPNYLLSSEDLKKPHSVMRALFQVLRRLGIDVDAMNAMPTEDEIDGNTMYYQDLIPIINLTRTVNQLVATMQNCIIRIGHFIQPSAFTSYPIILLMFNFMLFVETRLTEMAPFEEEIFGKREKVKALEDQKIKFREMLNELAQEKGNRSEKLDKLNNDINQIEEELRQEKESHDQKKMELQELLEEVRQEKLVIEQKKTQRDILATEVAKKKALRVFDADDIRTQAQQAEQNIQEAEQKLSALRESVMQKESCLKNLQLIKPLLDTTNQLLHEIIELTESLKEHEMIENQDGELELLNTDLLELESQLEDIRAARNEASKQRQDNQHNRQQKKVMAESALREAEERDREWREEAKKAKQVTQELKEATLKYDEDKKNGLVELKEIQRSFEDELKSFELKIVTSAKEAQKRIDDKFRGQQ